MDNGNGTDEDDYFVNGKPTWRLEIEDEEADSLIRETMNWTWTIGLHETVSPFARLPQDTPTRR
jgi:hypothetical protein